MTIIDSPYREVTRPIVDYVKGLRRNNPRELVAVYITEYVVGRWWETLLHNQSALRLKARLPFESGVMTINVPYPLRSTAGRDPDRAAHSPGEIRRGLAGASEPDGNQ